MLQNSHAQEDDTDYDPSSEEEYEDAAAEEEYYEEYYEEYEEDLETPDDFYYEDDPIQVVEATPFDDLVMISEEEIVTINVLGNDRASLGWHASPHIVEVTEPKFGQTTINSDNTITYAPSQVQLPSGYEKADVMRYTASVGGDSMYTGTITVTIQQVNDPPVAYSANYTIKENQQTTVYLDAYDEDGDSLTYTVLSSTTFGKSELDSYSGTLIYTPLFEFSGKETLTYQVSDGMSTSEVETILITVLEVGGESSPATSDDDDDEEPSEDETIEDSTTGNAQPIADAGSDFDALIGDSVTLDGGESYADGGLITYSWSQISGPQVSLSAADISNPTFDVPETESETDLVFELSVSDGNLTDTASVTVTVLPISIDLVPNAYPNYVYLSEPDSEIPVAIIGSSVLDASTNVDEESLRLGPDSALATRHEILDSDGDGIADHVSYFRTGDLGLELGDKTACFSGLVESVNGYAIEFEICKNVKVNA